jgi:hypothetical protein
VTQNSLKLTCEHIKLENLSGGKPPDPRSIGEGERGEGEKGEEGREGGEGRGGEGRGKGRFGQWEKNLRVSSALRHTLIQVVTT